MRSALGALGVGIVLSLPWLAIGCAALTSAANKVTPADRAKAYEAEANTAKLECKAYKFDRAAGLVPEVPAMSELCE
jgi:hypothetical protein